MQEANIHFKDPQKQGKMKRFTRRQLHAAAEAARAVAKEVRKDGRNWSAHDAEMRRNLRGVDLDRWYPE
jgi:hypothetical protein